MHFSGLAAASLVVPFVAAHSKIPGAPQIFGLGSNPIAKLKNRNVFHEHATRNVVTQQGSQLKARQGGVDGQCGPAAGGASCDIGYCCSAEGWCGTAATSCAAPDCLFQYGPACDANQTPGGTSTSSLARPQIGSVAYGGEGVWQCTVPGTVAITYDDGPYIYTAGILDLLATYNAKATFFITGNNLGKAPIDEATSQWPAVIQRMVTEGHQVASHTWSHQDLSAITSQQRRDQMVKNEMAIRNIIGKFPTYMRPPYSSCTAASGCEADMAALGYVVAYFDLDTDDYNNESPDLIQNAKNRVNSAVTPSNNAVDDFLLIAHDIHQQTAQNLTAYMLNLIQQKGYRMVTLGECLGEPQSAWYRDSAGSLGSYASPSPTASATATAPPVATPTTISPDGSCGGTTGFTCSGSPFGSCCSQYGYCGSSTDHCATGCQPVFGKCGGDALPSSGTVSSTAPTSTPTGPVSTDGSCGGTVGSICIGSVFGDCCSQYGYCGSTTGHCGTGCQSIFGNCGNSLSSSSTTIASSTASVLSGTSSTVSTVSAASSSQTLSTSSSQILSTSSTAQVVSSSTRTTSSSSTRISSSTSSSSTVSSTTRSSTITTTTRPTSTATSTTTRPASTSTRSSSTSTRSSSTSTRVSSTSTRVSSTSTRTSSATPTPTSKVSKDGNCGIWYNKTTCTGSSFGSCCRFDGKCGTGLLSCGIGCQNDYGDCLFPF